MRSKDPCGVFSELTYSYDTFLSTIIKKHWGGGEIVSVCAFFFERK